MDITQVKQLDKLIVLSFRLGLGPLFTGWLKDVGHILVLTTLGRESGLKQRAPANYALLRGGVYCVAASRWFHDVMANPSVEVWIGNQGYAGRAEHVQDPSDWLPAYRQVMINSGLAAKAFVGLDPLTASDATLLKVGADTPIVRIDIERAASGRGGPGDLVWMWPAAGAWLALAWWWQKRSR